MFFWFLGISGASKSLETVFLGINIGFVGVVPLIGFLTMIYLHRKTTLKFNKPFGIVFVVIFALATGGLLSLLAKGSDIFLGTLFLESNTDLMVDLIGITIGGVLIGFLLKYYIDKKDLEVPGIGSPEKTSINGVIMWASKLLKNGFGEKAGFWAPFASRLLQTILVIFFLGGIYTANVRWTFSALIALGITQLPVILTKNLGIYLPPLLNFLIVLALSLHVVGGFLGFYDNLWWWDNLTHTFSSFLIAVIGTVVLFSIDLYSTSIRIPGRYTWIFLLMVIMATGVIWEILEFMFDQILGTNMQYGLRDTVADMFWNMIGATIAAYIGQRYLEPYKQKWMLMK
ncbi:hypothetical protein [Methanonatronarchaeum sp. AMET-Sl]|uniref:hypothetical protein n=1 Tax=Methanonatronarchaeum sp. AMET-Sl TaxID=3037654 RepID=UPI00244E54CE|nr:hypothetical protein [Methanonatronarchaeum sp. AMET-Sl]WGI16705.1 hypothetical protein QEN48_04220 [Methanonatronarchaeum sp. AMET-Sl]